MYCIFKIMKLTSVRRQHVQVADQQQYRRDVLGPFFEQESHKREQENIKVADVIGFCIDLMNKMRRILINLRQNKLTSLTSQASYCIDLMNRMRRNLIKIRSCVIFSWFRFSSYLNVDRRLPFRLVSQKNKKRFYWLIHSV